MHVAMISVHTSPLAALGGKETGGMNVYVRELSRELAARGLEIDVFTRNRDSDTEMNVQPLAPGARVINIPAGPAGAVSKHSLYDHLPQFVEGISNWAERTGTQYDLLHAHYWLSGVAARMLQREWPGAPVVQMFHTLGALKNMVALGDHDRETDQRIICERELMKKVDRIIASTPRDQQQMVDLYGADPARISVIPPGVDLELFRPIAFEDAKDWFGAPYDDHTVLFVGRLDPVKGIDVWFRAMKIVVDRDPRLRSRMCVCLIGGDVDEEVSPESEFARLESLKTELGISDIVTFLGKRSQKMLPYYYGSADVVVMPSRYESFGLVALEAMACGCPVIASDVGGLSFVVRDGETGFLVPEGDAEALAACALEILHSRELRDRLGRNGIRVSREYSWPHISRRMVDLYRRLVPAAAFG